MCQDPVPQLGLGPRHGIMCLGQLLNVVRAGHHRVLKDLHRADLQHMQDDLGILRIVIVPAVVQCLPRAGQGDRRHQLQVKPCDTQMIHQHPMIVAGGFKTDAHWQAVFLQNRDQPREVVCAIGDREAPTAYLARDGNQHLVPVL
jgi:hypothetical protein